VVHVFVHDKATWAAPVSSLVACPLLGTEKERDGALTNISPVLTSPVFVLCLLFSRRFSPVFKVVGGGSTFLEALAGCSSRLPRGARAPFIRGTFISSIDVVLSLESFLLSSIRALLPGLF